jgi:hypothetical protein
VIGLLDHRLVYRRNRASRSPDNQLAKREGFPKGTAVALALVVAGSAGLCLDAKAAVLWDTYGSGFEQGYLSDGPGNHTNAQVFTLSHPSEITQFDWSGLNLTTATDDFSIQIYGNAAGMPATTALDDLTGIPVTRTLSSESVLGHTPYNYSTVLATPLSLAPGSYYFSVNNVPSAEWYWAVVSVSSGSFFVRDTLGPWDERTSTLAFVVQGATVPEPSTWAMMLLGFAGLSFAGYRTTRKAAPVAA